MAECCATLAASTTAIGKVLLPDGGDVPVNAFLGLPYARPPVGDLRFCPPQPLELWRGERDCKEYGAMSMQPLDLGKELHEMFHYPDVMSEDCLHLNVFTPNLGKQARLPVMVWFFGGGFGVGACDIYDGTALASFYDVIVVTVNYRLGPFGFLTTGDDVIPGNMGLLDQVEALQWVQKHITSFGGDPDNVTIFGESAGAVSCSLHIVSELTVGLFRRAIIQSGPATSPLSVRTRQQTRTSLQPKLEEMGFNGKTSQDLVTFLRSKPANELVSLVDVTCEIFAPVIDGQYLKDYPHNLYKEEKFQHVEIMPGFCSNEGYCFLQLFPLATDREQMTVEELREKLKYVISLSYSENVDAILDAVYKIYFTDDAIGCTDKTRQQYADMMGDMTFVAPNISMALKHAEGEPWLIADHEHDNYAVFGMGFTRAHKGVHQSDADKKVSHLVMAYWTNFAKTGNPNGTGLVLWSPFVSGNQSYLILKENTEEARDYQPEKMKFWDKEIPKLDLSRIYK